MGKYVETAMEFNEFEVSFMAMANENEFDMEGKTKPANGNEYNRKQFETQMIDDFNETEVMSKLFIAFFFENLIFDTDAAIRLLSQWFVYFDFEHFTTLKYTETI